MTDEKRPACGWGEYWDSRTPVRVRPVPTPGQHTDEVLGGLLGYERAALDVLRSSGAIAWGTRGESLPLGGANHTTPPCGRPPEASLGRVVPGTIAA